MIKNNVNFKKLRIFKNPNKMAKMLFLILTILLFIYSIVVLYQNNVYINSMVSSGQLTKKGNAYSIINYYVENAGKYLIYSFLFLGTTLIVNLLEKNNIKKLDTYEEKENLSKEKGDNGFEGWE